MPTKGLGIAFFIWIGIFNYLVVAQFWGFANDLYSEEAGKRLFPLIAFGATFGAVSGSWIAGGWRSRSASTASCPARPPGWLGVCIRLTSAIHRRDVRTCGARRPDVRAPRSPLRPGGGFRLVFRSRYLILIALIIGLYNFVNATGEYIFSDVADRGRARQAGRRPATAGGWAMERDHRHGSSPATSPWTNLIALVLQLFLVSRIFRWVGVGGALLVLPFFALGGYAFISFGATLLLVRWVKALKTGPIIP